MCLIEAEDVPSYIPNDFIPVSITLFETYAYYQNGHVEFSVLYSFS